MKLLPPYLIIITTDPQSLSFHSFERHKKVLRDNIQGITSQLSEG
ncbi:hypothetical protein LINPERPRIM_LOCUS24597 [Linum perenne]